MWICWCTYTFLFYVQILPSFSNTLLGFYCVCTLVLQLGKQSTESIVLILNPHLNLNVIFDLFATVTVKVSSVSGTEKFPVFGVNKLNLLSGSRHSHVKYDL